MKGASRLPRRPNIAPTLFGSMFNCDCVVAEVFGLAAAARLKKEDAEEEMGTAANICCCRWEAARAWSNWLTVSGCSLPSTDPAEPNVDPTTPVTGLDTACC